MTLSVEKEGNRFRVEWQGNSIDWLPDTVSNRKAILVFLRCLRDENGKHVFTHQELSKVVDSENRQASSGHVERFRECGSDFLHFLTRKRKVDSQVVEAVLAELLDTPLAETVELHRNLAYAHELSRQKLISQSCYHRWEAFIFPKPPML